MLVSDKMINILDEWIMEIPKIAVARGFFVSIWNRRVCVLCAVVAVFIS